MRCRNSKTSYDWVLVRVSLTVTVKVRVTIRVRVEFGHSELVLEFQHSEYEPQHYYGILVDVICVMQYDMIR